MDHQHPYWRYAEKINGRLAMLGLVIGTINYGLFGMDSTWFLLKNETQHTIYNSKKVQTHDSRSRKI